MAKTCYALYRKKEILDCYFSKAVAMREVDSRLGTGIFTKKWETDGKNLVRGDYTIVPCKVDYARVYTISVKRLHTAENPTIFQSIEALIKFVEDAGLKVKNYKLFQKTYRLFTDEGVLEGGIRQVK